MSILGLKGLRSLTFFTMQTNVQPLGQTDILVASLVLSPRARANQAPNGSLSSF